MRRCSFCDEEKEAEGHTKDGSPVCYECFLKLPIGQVLGDHDIDGVWTIICEDVKDEQRQASQG